MNFDPEILSGKKCPYCGDATEYVHSDRIYSDSKDYGMFYACLKCYAWVGTHNDRPKEAYGRLANSKLRQIRNRAHRHFDSIWKQKMARTGWSKRKARTAAYKWLAGELGIPVEYCHMGYFDEQTCLHVIKICKPYSRL